MLGHLVEFLYDVLSPEYHVRIGVVVLVFKNSQEDNVVNDMRSDLLLRMIRTGTLSSAYCDGANTILIGFVSVTVHTHHAMVQTQNS